jgi:hypothetical protein
VPKKLLNLADALLCVQVAKGGTAQAGGAVKDQTFSFAMESAFCEDGAHAFGLN